GRAIPGSGRAVPAGAEERSQGPDRALSLDPGAAQDRTEGRDSGSAQEARSTSRGGHPGGAGALSVQADRGGSAKMRHRLRGALVALSLSAVAGRPLEAQAEDLRRAA